MNISVELEGMAERHPGLTTAVAAYYAEGACVCLCRHHAPPTSFQLTVQSRNYTAEVNWKPVNNQTKSAWANRDDATRDGAYAMSLAMLEESEGLVAMHRAETRTGADYYVARNNSKLTSLEEAFRLEVSGLDKGDDSAINQRLERKKEQTRRGACNLPAIASVVGFKALVARIEYVEDV